MRHGMLALTLLCVLAGCGGNQASPMPMPASETAVGGTSTSVSTQLEPGSATTPLSSSVPASPTVVPISTIPVRVWDEDGFGYIDALGELVIDTQYEDALPFGEGVAAVKDADGWAFIDPTGHQVITPPAPIDRVDSFSDGLAAAYVGERYGFIDHAGQLVIPVIYPDPDIGNLALSFHHSLAVFATVGAGVNDERYGYIDRAGQVVIEAQFSWAEPFADSLALVTTPDVGDAFIDRSGTVVIDLAARGYGSSSFHNGRAATVHLSTRRHGYIDVAGEFVIAAEWDSSSNFSEGLAVVFREQSAEQWQPVIINRSGVVQTEIPYLLPGPDPTAFSDGLLDVYDQAGGRMGYLDTTGMLVIPLQYCYATPFQNGVARVSVPTGDEPCNPQETVQIAINRAGEEVWRFPPH